MVFGLLLLEYTHQDCEYITRTMGRPWIMVFTAWICKASLKMCVCALLKFVCVEERHAALCCNVKVMSLSLTKTTSFFLSRYCMRADNIKVMSLSLTWTTFFLFAT